MKNVSVGVAEMAVQHMPQDNSCLFHAIGYSLEGSVAFCIVSNIDANVRYLFLNQALGIAPQIRESKL